MAVQSYIWEGEREEISVRLTTIRVHTRGLGSSKPSHISREWDLASGGRDFNAAEKVNHLLRRQT